MHGQLSMVLLHSERPKLYIILAFLSAIGLSLMVHLKSCAPIFFEEANCEELKQCKISEFILGKKNSSVLFFVVFFFFFFFAYYMY